MLFHYQIGRFFLYSLPTDMRKGFDALCGTVYNDMKLNPLTGDLFIFINRTRSHIKMLHWQGDGYAIFYKRLEKGTYEILLPPGDSKTITISTQIIFLKAVSQKVCVVKMII